VARVDEFDLETRNNGDGTVISDRLEQHQRAVRVGARVERQGRLVLRVAVTVGVSRVFFLDMGGIGQDERAQVASAGRAEDPAFEALGNQAGEIAAVVEVGMRQDDGVDAHGSHGQRLPVAQP